MNPDPVSSVAPDKLIFQGNRQPQGGIKFPEAPPWRRFDEASRADRGGKHRASREEVVAVNAAIYLRRPLLITGKPGCGKTSLAYAVAHELSLGEVLLWPITSRTTLQQGLYNYDAIARLQDASMPREGAGNRHQAYRWLWGRALKDRGQAASSSEASDIGRYIRLGPLGAAFCCSESDKPRVLLIDEIDKSDIDLPNDLLHIFEEGEFEIPELARLPDDDEHRVVRIGLPMGSDTFPIERGRVRCRAFPIVFLTSNGERDFPPAFLRRCIRLDVPQPNQETLAEIVRQRLDADPENAQVKTLITNFLKQRDQGRGQLATDQLLNAVSLVVDGLLPPDHPDLKRYVLRDLAEN